MVAAPLFPQVTVLKKVESVVLNEIAGVVPPEELIGEVPITEVTVPPELLSVEQVMTPRDDMAETLSVPEHDAG